MFSAEDLKVLDPKYFTIILADEYDVTVMSRNTGHYWYIHNTEYPGKKNVIVHHRHNGRQPYHLHSRAKSLQKAIRDIKGHDRWQMNGRK